MPCNGGEFSVSLQSQQQGLLPLQEEPAVESLERGAHRTVRIRRRAAWGGSLRPWVPLKSPFLGGTHKPEAGTGWAWRSRPSLGRGQPQPCQSRIKNYQGPSSPWCQAHRHPLRSGAAQGRWGAARRNPRRRLPLAAAATTVPSTHSVDRTLSHRPGSAHLPERVAQAAWGVMTLWGLRAGEPGTAGLHSLPFLRSFDSDAWTTKAHATVLPGRHPSSRDFTSAVQGTQAHGPRPGFRRTAAQRCAGCRPGAQT